MGIVQIFCEGIQLMANPSYKWRNIFFVNAYELARQGFSDNQIAKSLGVSTTTLQIWKKKKRTLREAIKRGRGGSESHMDAMTYAQGCYEHLTPEAQDCFDRMTAFHQEQNGIKRMEAMLRDQGKGMRQMMFITALISRNYNISEACRFTNIRRQTFDIWVATEPGFSQLMDEILEKMKDDFQMHLYKQSKSGEVAATKFALSALAKERGFGEKIQHEVSGKIEHEHKHVHVKIDDLNLDLDTRKEILQAIREKQNTQNVIEVQKA